MLVDLPDEDEAVEIMMSQGSYGTTMHDFCRAAYRALLAATAKPSLVGGDVIERLLNEVEKQYHKFNCGGNPPGGAYAEHYNGACTCGRDALIDHAIALTKPSPSGMAGEDDGKEMQELIDFVEAEAPHGGY